MIQRLWDFLNYFVFLYPLYMSFVWTIGGLIFYFRRERNKEISIQEFPFFSIIVPAHNEQGEVEKTVSRLKDLNYPAYEVIVVNDGSNDATEEILDKLVSKYPEIIKVIHIQPNSGKAMATNMGVLFSKGELILVMDADCFLDKDALRAMAWHFINSSRVGAVTGNPRIVNRTSLLAKIQIGEYSSIIGLIKRSQRILGKLLTVSGVIAAYRKCALCDVDFFSSDCVTEDIDVTWKLQKKFWDVRYEPRALCWIFAPETIRGLWLQRVRWAQGGVEVLKKHFNVWADFRQRRFWPVYIESSIDIIWAFAMGLLFIIWAGTAILFYLNFSGIKPVQPLVPPEWTGSILALVCLLQFMVSLYIDAKYEKKSFLKYYFWIIWYPFFYWVLSGVAVVVGVVNVFIRKKGVSIKWEHPDRGLQKSK